MQLTVRQHFVPRVYLRGWNDLNDQVRIFDKAQNREFKTTVKNILVENNYYEDTASPPTNELEKKFGDYETEFGNTQKFISFVIANAAANGDDIPTTLESMLNALKQHRECIQSFAATAYFRTPGALRAMQEQLGADVGNEAAAKALASVATPYGMGSAAFESSLLKRFKNLHVALLHSDIGIDTSDCPCYPVSVGDDLSNFGYDIGRHGATIAVLPLTPSLVAIFLPNLNDARPYVLTKSMPSSLAVQLNDLTHNKAERWVVRAQ